MGVEVKDGVIVGDVNLSTVHNDAEAIARGVASAMLLNTDGQSESDQIPTVKPIFIAKQKIELEIMHNNSIFQFSIHRKKKRFRLNFGEISWWSKSLNMGNIIWTGFLKCDWYFEKTNCQYPFNEYSYEFRMHHPSRFITRNSRFYFFKLYYNNEMIFSSD